MRIINLTNSTINLAPTSCNVDPNTVSGEFTALRTVIQNYFPPMVSMYGVNFLMVVSSEEKVKYPKLFNIFPAENLVDASTFEEAGSEVPEGYKEIYDDKGNKFVYKVPEGASLAQVQSDWKETNPESPAFIRNKPETPAGGVSKAELDKAIKAEATRTDNMINQLNKNVSDGFNTINKNVSDGFNTINGAISNEIKPEIENNAKAIDDESKARVKSEETINESLATKVPFTPVPTEDLPERKAIVLENHDTLLGKMKDGTQVNVAMVSKYEVVDLGSPKLPINLNTPAGVRPTVQEQGVAGPDAEKIAYLSDLDGVLKVVEQEDGKKVIVVNNDVLLMGQSNPNELENKIEVDGPVPLIRVNPRNVVEVGTPKTITNINTPNGQRPTVQEQSQSGQEAHKIAYVDDLSNYVPIETYNELLARVEALEAKMK